MCRRDVQKIILSGRSWWNAGVMDGKLAGDGTRSNRLRSWVDGGSMRRTPIALFSTCKNVIRQRVITADTQCGGECK